MPSAATTAAMPPTLSRTMLVTSRSRRSSRSTNLRGCALESDTMPATSSQLTPIMAMPATRSGTMSRGSTGIGAPNTGVPDAHA